MTVLELMSFDKSVKCTNLINSTMKKKNCFIMWQSLIICKTTRGGSDWNVWVSHLYTGYNTASCQLPHQMTMVKGFDAV